jgi:hypothetical protein
MHVGTRTTSVLMSALLVAVLTACGSSGKSSTSQSTGFGAAGNNQNSAQLSEARIQAANCIRGEGINIPDLTPGGGRLLNVLRIVNSYPQVKVRAALKACDSEIRKAFPQLGSLTPQQIAERRRAAAIFAQCMRAHGVPFPDFSTTGLPTPGTLATLIQLQKSPAYKATEPLCQSQALKGSGLGAG